MDAHTAEPQTNSTAPHPSAEQLRAFGQGLVSPAELAAIQAHLDACPACCAALGEGEGDDPFLARLRRAGRGLPTQDTVDPTTPAQAGESDDALPSVSGYEILGVLGRGGMGVVYKARHLALNRLVALKVLLGGAHAGPEAVVRFRAEAEAVVRLRHPNVVQIYDLGLHAGVPYLALELCKGGTLAEHSRGQPLPPHEAAQLLEALAQGVAAAHEQGIVHRDLKPANVLLTEAGEPKVADFGLAKQLDASTRTPSGAVLGTPSYMAPEQATGRGVGPAADIYALGAILYECLTGRPPFQAASPIETLSQVVAGEPVPPRRLNSAVPRDLETVCLKCLHKEPDRRYASAQALAVDLGRFRSGEAVTARRVGLLEQTWRRVRRSPLQATLAAVLTALVLAGVASALYLDRQRALRQVLAASELDQALERVAFFQGQGKRAEALAALERAQLLAGEAAPDPARSERLADLQERLAADARDQ